MHSNRMVFVSLFCGLMLVSISLNAALNFKQEFTLTSFKSEEDVKDVANQFLQAAEGDSNLKVVNVRYKQEKWAEDCIAYEAVLTCHVSKPDKDLLRIQEKMIQNNSNLIRGNSLN